eukprot:m.246233 g.246233  ORF g.246233 m.246233 type:complete len:401 (-) comp68362_c0_seq1:158-1360(-)
MQVKHSPQKYDEEELMDLMKEMMVSCREKVIMKRCFELFKESPALWAVVQGVKAGEIVLGYLNGKDDKNIKWEVMEQLVLNTRRKQKALLERFIRAQQVLLCFLVDTTGSMAGHMRAVRTQIVDIVKKVEETSCKVVGVGFVGYKDFDDDQQFDVLSFTKNLETFKSFVGNIEADGGNDEAENVLGGLEKAVFELDWADKGFDGCTKVLYHIADAPPHNTKYHDDANDNHEDYEHNPSSEELFQKINELNIMYYFGRINSSCEKMINVFSDEMHYGREIEAFDNEDILRIADSVTSSVMESVSLTPKEKTKKKIDPLADVCDEDPWVSCSLKEYSFPRSVEGLSRGEKLPIKRNDVEIRIAAHPFADGAERLAFKGEVRCFGEVQQAFNSTTRWQLCQNV